MSKNTDVTVYSTHTTDQEAVKSLEKSGFDMQPNMPPASATTGKTARERLRLRTRELAVLAGRRSIDITQRDYEQAKREVAGESFLKGQNPILDSHTSK